MEKKTYSTEDAVYEFVQRSVLSRYIAEGHEQLQELEKKSAQMLSSLTEALRTSYAPWPEGVPLFTDSHHVWLEEQKDGTPPWKAAVYFAESAGKGLSCLYWPGDREVPLEEQNAISTFHMSAYRVAAESGSSRWLEATDMGEITLRGKVLLRLEMNANEGWICDSKLILDWVREQYKKIGSYLPPTTSPIRHPGK